MITAAVASLIISATPGQHKTTAQAGLSMNMQFLALQARLSGFSLGQVQGKNFHTGPIEVLEDRTSTHFGKSFTLNSKGQGAFFMPYVATLVDPKGGIQRRKFRGSTYQTISWTARSLGPEALWASLDPQLPPGGPIVETGDIEIGKDTDDDITVESGSGPVVIVVDKSVNINCKKCIPEKPIPGGGRRPPAGGGGFAPISASEFGQFMLASANSLGLTQLPSLRSGPIRLRFVGAALKTPSEVESMLRKHPQFGSSGLSDREVKDLAVAASQNLSRGMPLTIALKVTCAPLGWNGKWIIAGQTVTGSQTLGPARP